VILVTLKESARAGSKLLPVLADPAGHRHTTHLQCCFAVLGCSSLALNALEHIREVLNLLLLLMELQSDCVCLLLQSLPVPLLLENSLPELHALRGLLRALAVEII
jgi:hypothetical protein